MRVISVINYKGGVGKTTVSSNLGAELAFRGKRVLMIDLDPQCSMTFSFIQPDEWEKNLEPNKTIKAWYDAHVENKPLDLDCLISTPKSANSHISKGKLDLIASHLGLLNVDLELATGLSGGSLAQVKRNFVKIHNRLALGLDQVRDEYDIVLIDCPPNFNIVTKTAIVASDSILIPAKPDYLSTLGIDYLVRNLRQLVKDYNEFSSSDGEEKANEIAPAIIGVIFTMVQFYGGRPITALRKYITQTKRLGINVFDNYFRENKSVFATAAEECIPVVLVQHDNQTFDMIVKEIESVTTEFVTRGKL